MVLFSLSSVGWALPPPPAPITVTNDELVTLTNDEVVFRYNPEGQSVAIVDVLASPDVVMAAVMDLTPRVDEIDGLRAMELYAQAPDTVSVRWDLGVALYTATFHTEYRFDLIAGWCVYGLDEQRNNDIQRSDGSYQVYANGAGSRLIYRSNAEYSLLIPAGVARRLARNGAIQLMIGIKLRAEK